MRSRLICQSTTKFRIEPKTARMIIGVRSQLLVETIDGGCSASRKRQRTDADTNPEPVHRCKKRADTLKNRKCQAGPGNSDARSPRTTRVTLHRWNDSRDIRTRH